MLARTLKEFWRSSLSAELEYRLNFIVSTLNVAGQMTGTLFTLGLLYRKGAAFNGWSWHQALLIVALFMLLEGLAAMLLNPNLSRIIAYVQRGTLDFILLKPIDAQLHVSVRNFSIWGIPNVLLALGLLFYAGHNAGVAWHGYLLGITPVLLSCVIMYCLWFAVATSTIWFTKVWNATEVLRSFLEAGRYPMAAYPTAVQFFFTFVLPIAFLTTVPAEIMLGRAGITLIFIEAAIALVLLIATRLFWRIALRYYTSASS